MHRLVVVCVLLSMLVPCVALAQDIEDGDGDSTWRLRGGYFDLGDFDDGWGIGMDYMSDFGPRMKWGAGAEWLDIDTPTPIVTEAKGAWGVKQAYGFILFMEFLLCEHEVFEGFLGAGATWHSFDNAVSDDALGGRAYAGAKFGDSREFEILLGYDFREKVFGDWDSDGINAQVGWQVDFW